MEAKAIPIYATDKSKSVYE